MTSEEEAAASFIEEQFIELKELCELQSKSLKTFEGIIKDINEAAKRSTPDSSYNLIKEENLDLNKEVRLKCLISHLFPFSF